MTASHPSNCCSVRFLKRNIAAQARCMCYEKFCDKLPA
jgi:hypothetical protein